MKRATISDAPTVLNTNDKAMWVLGHTAAADALDAIPTSWELSHGNDDEEEQPLWRVHRRHGSVNDLEWTLLGTGRTPSAALAAAHGVTPAAVIACRTQESENDAGVSGAAAGEREQCAKLAEQWAACMVKPASALALRNFAAAIRRGEQPSAGVPEGVRPRCLPGTCPMPTVCGQRCSRQDRAAAGGCVQGAVKAQPHDWREGLGYWQCKRCGIVSHSGQENGCTGGVQASQAPSLREALELARPYVENATVRMYDGTNGNGIRDEATRRLVVIDAALADGVGACVEPSSDALRLDWCIRSLERIKEEVGRNSPLGDDWQELVKVIGTLRVVASPGVEGTANG